ncbi:MAG: glycosyltransferase family 2 protein [Ilumatobacteraceae bacterium]
MVLAVVVTTYSAPPEMLARCLRSVLDGGGADAVIVVDNGGHAVVPDGVELLQPGRNGGFGAAANLGFGRAVTLGATACALLNDDVVVEPGWLDPLVAELRVGERIGAVQPKLLVAGTSPAVVNSLGVAQDRYGQGQDVAIGAPDDPADVAPRDVEMFTAGAVLLAMDFVGEVGGFDERYFMYYEDVDLGRRGAELGWCYRCAPASRVWHEGGVSSASLGGRRAALAERNRLWVLWRFADWRTIAAGVWLAVRRVLHAPRLCHAQGLVAGLAGAPRRLGERRRAGRR